ncbi:MAG: homoserine kinase [Clostridia bacterium]|nr:homoserine kinase [Clostridia bacterium]
MVTVRVPATTANLGPGFDVLGLALNLYNFVEMSFTAGGLQIEIIGEGTAGIPRDENNIVFRAAQKVWQKCNYDCQGVRIRLINNIPLARGLGSSAAAITGGMVAANALLDYPLSNDELLQLATGFEGHPDNVAPALLGGLVMSIMEGENVISHKIPVQGDLQVGAIIPHFTLSTENGRQILPQQFSREDAIFNVGRTALLVAAFLQRKYDLLQFGMQDRLHQPYRSSLVPGMETAFQKAKAAGASGVALSGSGPTVVAFGVENMDVICGEMLAAFAEQGIEASIMKLLPDNEGARVINGGL